jgi:YVTN family beta-propeller protein
MKTTLLSLLVTACVLPTLVFSLTAQTRIPLGLTQWMDNVNEVAATPDGNEVWALSCASPYLAVIDVSAGLPGTLHEIKIPGDWRAPTSDIVFSSDGQFGYLVNTLQYCYQEPCTSFLGNYKHILVVSRIKREVEAIIPIDAHHNPTASLAVSPDGSTLYYPVEVDGIRQGIVKLDLSTRQATDFLEVAGVSRISITKDGKKLLAAQGWPIWGTSPGKLSIIDLAAFQVTATIKVGDGPISVSSTPDGKKACVSNLMSHNVSLVDLDTNQVTSTIEMGSEPWEIIVTPDGKKAYVGSMGNISILSPGNAIAVIDLERETLVKFIQVGTEPSSVSVSPDGNRVFVSVGNANGTNPAKVQVVNANSDTLQQSIIIRPAARYAPTGIAANSEGTRIYVISESRRSLILVDALLHAIRRELPISPRAVAISPHGQRLFVFCPHYQGRNQATLLQLNAVTLDTEETIALGDTGTSEQWDSVVDRIAFNDSEDKAYLTAGDKMKVMAVDLIEKRIVGSVGVSNTGGNMPARGLALSVDGSTLFASDCAAKNIAVIDASNMSLQSRIPVDVCPSELQVSASGMHLWVLQQYSTKVLTRIDIPSRTVSRVVNFPPSLIGSYDFFVSDDETLAYILCFDPNWMMIYDLTETNPMRQIRALLKTGLDPFNLATSPSQRSLWVSNFSSDTISLIDPVSMQILDTIKLQPPRETSMRLQVISKRQR